MDIAVLSDIHGNYKALQRCLEHAFSKNITTIFFLGDYIGELAYPERTMKILYELDEKYTCYFIKGNKEDYWLKYRADGETGWEFNNSTTGALIYAYKKLTDKDLEFFSRLRPVDKVKIETMPEITLCHGSPRKINEKMLPNDEKTIEVMRRTDTSTILCGHSHVQRKIVHENKSSLNPGSVGISLHSEGRAQFMILHGEDSAWQEEFVSLEYDVEGTIKELHESGMFNHAPYWSVVTENILRGGNISHARVLSRAMELCREENGTCTWPYIPESCWAQAVGEMIK